VGWEVAEDEAFRRIVARGRYDAGPERDFTVKVEATGLRPGVQYWYRFRSGPEVSPVGRTRTLPAGAVDKAVLAFVCCQHYECGRFNVHRAVAELEELDAVVCLGDYIYEDAALASAYVRRAALTLKRVAEPACETRTLSDYRRRHALYKTDPDLQAAHARAPWICVWDDHETADDCWRGGAKKQASGAAGWSAREAAALRAYYEWMPIREPAAGQAETAINRSFDFGDLFSLIMLESRLMARGRQLDYESLARDGEPDIAALRAKLMDPARQMLGARQEAWLAATLDRSVATGRAWQVVGSQVVMGQVLAPDLRQKLGPLLTDVLVAALPGEKREEAARLVRLTADRLPYNTDAWDGYPAARERVYDAFRRSGARPIVVSGDSHAFWINELNDASSRRVGVELGVSSVTSPGAGDVMPMVDFNGLFEEANPDVRFCHHSARGYVKLTLTRDGMLGELIAVSSVGSRTFDLRTLRKARVRRTPAGMGELEVA
jgi:alkaline phosphatase D